jgi:hypothetical protein
MALYAVSYDLSKPEQEYPQLLEYLHLIGARRLLDSQWMVRSGATRDAVYNGIRGYLDTNDALLVCLVGSAVGANLKHPLGEIWTENWAGGLPPSIDLLVARCI